MAGPLPDFNIYEMSNETEADKREGSRDQQPHSHRTSWPQLQTPLQYTSSLVEYTGGKRISPEEESAEIEFVKHSYHQRYWSAEKHYTPRYQGPPPLEFLPGTPTRGSRKGKEREVGIMDHINVGQLNPRNEGKSGYDAFDSLEWDPDLPTTSALDDSPQPIVVKPQPLTYTTVGSLVDPNATPQFSAPNRIQREGANRRPLMAIIRNQQFDALFQTRGPPPPLSTSSSMHYTQNLVRSPPPVDTSSTSASDESSQSTNGQTLLNEQEKDVLAQQFGHNEPQLMSGNAFLSSRQASVLPKVHVFDDTVNDLDVRGRLSNIQGQIQGMEKMQTLQRLSKFANPVQHLARTRLSEFAVANAQAMHRHTNNSGDSKHHDLMSTYNQRVSDYQSEDAGQLNLNFQFPPPGFGHTSTMQANPLVRTTSSNSTQSNYIPSRPPGYPQPLTAGPPGQRQYNSSLGQHVSIQNAYDQDRVRVTNHDLESRNANLRLLLDKFTPNSPSSQSVPQSQVEYPYDEFAQEQNTPGPSKLSQPQEPYQFGGVIKAHTGYCTTRLLDTLAPHSAEKYYPMGFHGSYNGVWKEMSAENQVKMAPNCDKIKKERRAAELEEWFYEGQGRFWGMNEDDHLREHKERLAKKHDFGPIGPPKKVHAAVETKPVTVEEVQKTTTAELAKPMMAALYGTMLEYSDRSNPDSRANLSQFIDSDPAHIDPTLEGNKSLFGEDWGAPVKQSSSTYRF